MGTNEKLKNLARKYGLKYQYQEFENCYGGNWLVCTHSIYNESGCFTIHCVPQRLEVDFYFSDRFSRNQRELCTKEVNVYEFEKSTWEKDQKIGPFKNPFFFWSPNNIIDTLIKVIAELIKKNNEFFGVQVSSP